LLTGSEPEKYFPLGKDEFLGGKNGIFIVEFYTGRIAEDLKIPVIFILYRGNDLKILQLGYPIREGLFLQYLFHFIT
jgi:hypothetical protein